MRGNMMGRHADVLDAKPSDDAGKASLVAEIKRRGNAAFKARSMDEAVMLYAKCIEHVPDNHIFYGNRAAAYLVMGKHADALKDSDCAVEIDPSWTKGWFRRAQALSKLGRHGESAEAYDQAGQPPKAAAERALAAETERVASAAPPTATTAPPPPPSTSSTTGPAATATDSATTTKKKTKKKKAKGGSMKGYKTTADGRTTSFFHNDLDATAQALVGDYKAHIAPQAVAASAASVVVNKSGVGALFSFFFLLLCD